jgi:hypothetical protein
MSTVGLFATDNAVADRHTLDPGRTSPFDPSERTCDLIIGDRKLRTLLPAIRELRLRCGQQNDLTTDPQYFIAANTLKDRRVAAVLIRRDLELEACVLFFEHCKFGMGLGVFRGGDGIGESLVAGPEAFHVQYIHLATQALLRHWRIHGVSLAVMASVDQCIDIMGPEGEGRMFSARNIARKLPLESSYRAVLAGMGRGTRRSLAGKRQQLETRANVAFQRALDPAEALEAMLHLQSRSLPHRITKFYQARTSLHRERPEFFCMGMRLPDGAWLSVLSGWRRNRVTYVDLQMNDIHYKKESLSAVMRAFLLEHEIACRQEFINFVGGTSLLLRRYCQPIEPATYAFLWRPCLRAMLFKAVVPHLKPENVYERVVRNR